MTARLRPKVVQPRHLETRLSSSFQSPAAQFRDDNITEAEARKRLSSYVVILIEKSSPVIDEEGNLVPSTWEQASHMIQSDVSQQEAKYRVRELNRETGSVSDKKYELSSALQRQLERAHDRLERMESDRRYVYTLAQLDWKFKRVETPREHYERHDKRIKDKKTTKERHRSRSKKERVSVTAYFKREPSNNENWLKMYKRQQNDKKEDETQLYNSGSSKATAAQPLLQRPLVEGSSATPLPKTSWGSVPRVVEEPNRMVQFSSSRMKRQDTSGSQNSKSSAISFSSFSSEDSNGHLTPNSSVDDVSSHHHHHHHHEEGRGRSRYRQSRNEEPFEVVVARSQPRRDSVGRYERIPPPVPDPTRPEPKPATDLLRRMEQKVCEEGMARSRSVKDSLRQTRLVQSPLEKQRDSIAREPRYAPSGEDGDQLGNRLSRISLADEPRSNRREPAADPTAHYAYREPMRQYRDDDDEELLKSEPNGIVWRKQDAQRYMNRRRFDQDAWDLGRSSPLQYTENGRGYI